jgi:hypothetical protein
MKPSLIVQGYIYVAPAKLVDYFIRLDIKFGSKKARTKSARAGKAYISFVAGSCLCLQLISPILSSATTIVIIRRADEIVAAADSAQLLADSAGGRHLVSTCKFGRVGDVFFVYGGVVIDTSGNYDVRNLATQACADTGTLLDKVKRFEKVALKPFAKSIEEMSKTPASVNAPTLYIAFFGIEQGLPVLHARQWTARKGATGSMTVSSVYTFDCPGKDCDAANPSKVQTMYFGIYDHIEEVYINNPSPGFGTTDIAEIARQLVTLEIRAHPAELSAPVNVLRLRPGRTPAWIGNKGVCPEIR